MVYIPTSIVNALYIYNFFWRNNLSLINMYLDLVLQFSMQRDHSKVFHSGFEADNVTAKSCIPMHPSIPKWATAANMILILTITKQHYTWSLSTGPLTKESRMFFWQKQRGIRVIRNWSHFIKIKICQIFIS